MTMTTGLARFTRKARAEPRTRFNALMGLVFDPEGLHASFERQDGRKARGVDGIRKSDYAVDVEANIMGLSRRLRCMGYRPQPARRVYIPKGDGRYRPLGVPCFEDRLVQDRMSLILQAIWEPEFRECSFGFRPGRSAHDALRQVAQVVTFGDKQWVVESDVKRFFRTRESRAPDALPRPSDYRPVFPENHPAFSQSRDNGRRCDERERLRYPARRPGLARPLQHLPPLRAGPLVREAFREVVSRQGAPRALR